MNILNFIRKIYAGLTDEEFRETIKRNEAAADRLDRAVKEMIQK